MPADAGEEQYCLLAHMIESPQGAQGRDKSSQAKERLRSLSSEGLLVGQNFYILSVGCSDLQYVDHLEWDHAIYDWTEQCEYL